MELLKCWKKLATQEICMKSSIGMYYTRGIPIPIFSMYLLMRIRLSAAGYFCKWAAPL